MSMYRVEQEQKLVKDIPTTSKKQLAIITKPDIRNEFLEKVEEKQKESF